MFYRIVLCSIIILACPPLYSMDWLKEFAQKYVSSESTEKKPLFCPQSFVEETDDEFINRTQQEKQCSRWYAFQSAQARVNIQDTLSINPFYDKKSIIAYNKQTNEKRVLYSYYDYYEQESDVLFSCSPQLSRLIVLDNTCAHNCIKEFSFDGIEQKSYNLNRLCIEAVAILDDGAYHAFICKDDNDAYFLKIYNKNTESMSENKPLELTTIRSIAFNKQQTKLIIHSKNDEHVIISDEFWTHNESNT